MTESAPSDRRIERLSAALVGFVAFLVYLWTLSPEVFWLDSAELVAASHTLGGGHPPGQPVYLILAKLASLLPVGSVAIRVNLLSALLGAGALALLHTLALEALRGTRRRQDLRHAATVGAAVLVFGLSSALWFQSVRAELYTLNLFLCLAALLSLVGLGETPSRPGAVPAAAFLFGLGLGNHHLLVLLTLPAGLWLLATSALGRRWLRPGRLALLAGIGLVALAPYALLPLRARLLPDMAWGDPSSLAGFLDVVSARVFQSSLDPSTRAALGDNLLEALRLFAHQLTPPVAGLGVAGLLLTLWRRPRLGLALLLLFAGSLASKVFMFLDPDNPDDHGYFGLALAMLALGAGVALASVVDRVLRASARGWVAAATGLPVGALLAAALLFQFQVHRPGSDLSGFRGPAVVTQASLEAVPPRALVMPYYYALHFLLQYAQGVEQRRPDVDVVHQGFHAHIEGGAPYRAWLRAKVRGGESLATAWEREDAFPAAAVREMARHRPVYLEAYTELALEPAQLEALGVLARVLPAGRAAEASTQARQWRERYWGELLHRLQGESDRHRHTRAFVLWYLYLEAALKVRQGDREGALAAVARGRLVSPGTRSLGRLEAWLESLAPLPASERLARMRQADLRAITR